MVPILSRRMSGSTSTSTSDPAMESEVPEDLRLTLPMGDTSLEGFREDGLDREREEDRDREEVEEVTVVFEVVLEAGGFWGRAWRRAGMRMAWRWSGAAFISSS